MTDSIILALTLFFSYRGWSQGLLRTLIGPIALLLGCIMAVIHYSQNHNIIMAFAISVVAPMLLNLSLSFVLTIWNKTINTDKTISPASRAWGAGLCALWGGINLLLVIVADRLDPQQRLLDRERAPGYFQLQNVLSPRPVDETSCPPKIPRYPLGFATFTKPESNAKPAIIGRIQGRPGRQKHPGYSKRRRNDAGHPGEKFREIIGQSEDAGADKRPGAGQKNIGHERQDHGTKHEYRPGGAIISQAPSPGVAVPGFSATLPSIVLYFFSGYVLKFLGQSLLKFFPNFIKRF